ncbi:outer membrane immunogenic protein [Methylopila capsulata]|uniref:Outer membrane immunogenic protein n=1 Tax=Methylopila capsulata TaxID=61654 RepID=A0A9W6IXS7_9HYPH|nr:outer membrane protein [Methylopila capsulata]MBM7852857.1 outer membrane immunogenic protein [Methylopila capsulata]GLK57066.1 porin [Methylopila capsulata]
MTSLLRTAVSAAALLAGVSLASAADLPAYEAPAAIAVSGFTWTGFYVGAHAGYVWGDHDIKTRGKDDMTRSNVDRRLRPPSIGIDGDGWMVGAQAGYNFQLDNSPIVFGVEADISYTDIDDTRRYAIPFDRGPGIIRSSFKQELEFLGTVRGRLGYAFDRVLVYGTGGLAYGKVKTSARFLNNSTGGGTLGFSDRESGVEVGYAVGGGVEYAVTDNITVKGEYLYYDLGDTKLNVNRTALAPVGQSGYRSKFENDGHIARLGVNYKF